MKAIKEAAGQGRFGRGALRGVCRAMCELCSTPPQTTATSGKASATMSIISDSALQSLHVRTPCNRSQRQTAYSCSYKWRTPELITNASPPLRTNAFSALPHPILTDIHFYPWRSSTLILLPPFDLEIPRLALLAALPTIEFGTYAFRLPLAASLLPVRHKSFRTILERSEGYEQIRSFPWDPMRTHSPSA